MSAHRTSDHPAASIAVRFIAAFGVMLVLMAGIFVWGRLAENDRTAMLLTAAWFAIVLVAGALLTRKRTSLRLPLALGFGIVAAAAAILLGLPMIRDDVVNERVVTAAPQATTSDAASRAAPARNTQIARGTFQSIDHPGTGTAAVIKLTSGKRVLTLTRFETDNGPDLRVYLSTGNRAGAELGDFKDLGALKGNKGSQQYEIPPDVNIRRFSTVVIWCRAFSVAFTSAVLTNT
jgi:hypothetical protein